LFYPSSNGYNSYYDKDEESIGGLEVPPPVSKELLVVSIVFEVAAILFALVISWQFSLMVLGISLVSRSYSHPSIRLKKYPVLGLITVALFQGAYTYIMAYIGISGEGLEVFQSSKIIWAGGLCSLMLFGSYPMTQIYQHNEDGRRGDLTMSRILGIKGTFIWTGTIFFIASIGFIGYFYFYYSIFVAILFPLFLTPTLIYFLNWFRRVLRNDSAADFKSTMRLNLFSSISFVSFFILLHYLQRYNKL
jgi:1,4-dihydroxy-2-naphthoate octaprenyltransferase